VTVPAYPLQWPAGWKRTAPADRGSARFGVRKQSQYGSWKSLAQLSVAEAVSRIRGELDSMGIHDDDLVISTNLALRLDGLPRSNQAEPADPGAAVYWTDRYDKSIAPRCMAIDRYDRVADNLAAIAATLDAMRAIERHGGAEILNRAFTGFAALPDQTSESWWIVLGVARDAQRAEIDDAYRHLRSQHHPDRGGDPEQFQRVQRAYEEACR
jgi:hypothetical protein